MFTRLVEWGCVFLLALTTISQLIVPLFVPKLELFWIFKSKKEKPVQTGPLPDLEATVAVLKEDTLAKAKALDINLHKVDDSIKALTDVKESAKV